MEQTVEYVETFCDSLEEFFTKETIEELDKYNKRVSPAASIAALRVHFYVLKNQVDSMLEADKCQFINHQLRYNKLAFLLMKDALLWNRLSYKEKAALLVVTDISSVFVYVRKE